jgi:peptidoglycan/LPS O-acetylase OafA/YrhL
MDSRNNTIPYRPGIDGLRAVAVASVCVYHLNKQWLPGGFVGVDVFFVISGFLITQVLSRSYKSETFSYLRFYQRRIARIFPQSLLACAVTLATAWFVYSPEELGAVGSASVAAAACAANIKFAFQGTYFDFPPDIQPLLHYWSLGVEEQFYFFWPMILGALWAQRPRSRLGILILVGLASIVACVLMTAANPASAFYLLPFRAWELLAGCLLAMIETRSLRSGVCAVVQGAGLSLICMSFVFIDGSNFPGIWAAAPVLGATLVLGSKGSSPSWIERLLSLPFLVWIGKISFAIYIWHWPVYCFVDYVFFVVPVVYVTAMKIGVTAFASLLTYWFFEQPLRRVLNEKANFKAAYSFFVCGTCALMFSGGIVNAIKFSNVNVKFAEVASGGYARQSLENDFEVVLIGDSNAGMYGAVFLDICTELNVNCNILSVHSSDPFPGSELWDAYQEYMRSHKPDVVVYVCAWGPKYTRVEESLGKAVEEILCNADSLVMVCKPPTLPISGTREWIRANGYADVFEDLEDQTKRLLGNDKLKSFSQNRVEVVDVDALFILNGGAVRIFGGGREQLFYDRGHLSYHGALLVKPLIKSAISKALAQNPAIESRN